MAISHYFYLFFVFLIGFIGACGSDDELTESQSDPAPIEHHVLYENRLQDVNEDESVVEVHLTAGWADIEVADGLTLPMMTYNGMFPGPLLEANVGDRVIVHFTNNLQEPTTVH